MKIKTYFSGLKKEWHKITWTSKKDLVRQTTAVISISAIAVLMISVFDSLALALLSFLP